MESKHNSRRIWYYKSLEICLVRTRRARLSWSCGDHYFHPQKCEHGGVFMHLTRHVQVCLLSPPWHSRFPTVKKKLIGMSSEATTEKNNFIIYLISFNIEAFNNDNCWRWNNIHLFPLQFQDNFSSIFTLAQAVKLTSNEDERQVNSEKGARENESWIQIWLALKVFMSLINYEAVWLRLKTFQINICWRGRIFLFFA